MTTFSLVSLVCWDIALTLLHVSWVGLLIGLIAATANRVMRNASASHRCSVNFAALLMFAVSLPIMFAIVRHSADAILETAPIALDSIEETVQQISRLTGTSSLAVAPTSDIGTAFDGPHLSVLFAQPATNSTPEMHFEIPSSWNRSGSVARSVAPVIAIPYVLGVFLILIKLVIGVRVNQRICAASRPVSDATILSRMAEQAKKLSLRMTPSIAYCDYASVPIVVGFLRPMILVPAMIVTGLTIEQLESVLSHELAHLHRRDHLVIVVQRFLEAILFFHPVTWYLSHCINDERETSCDDLVLALGGDRLQYAQSLLRVAELRMAGNRYQSLTALAADGQRPSKLRQRIARVLEDSEANSARVSSLWPIVGLIATTCIGYSLVNAIAIPAIAEEPKIQATLNSTTDDEQDPGAIALPPLRLPSKIADDVPQDADGRALPPGMIRRFGSVQFRSGATAWQSAAFSADGEWIWCKADGVTVMHRRTGHVIKGVNLGIDRSFGVSSIAMSPNGTLVAVAGINESAKTGESKVSENRVVLFNSNSGTKMSTIEWQAAFGGASYLAISHDESTLLTGDYWGDVRLWNIATGKETARIAIGLEFQAAAISPDGNQIVLVGLKESLLWNPGEDGPPKFLSPRVHYQMAVCYSPDGKYFVTGCWVEKDGYRLWDGKTGEMVAQLVANGTTGHPDGGLAFTPDSRILAVPVANADCVELWDVESRKLLTTFPVNHARAVTISRDGNWLAALGDSQRVQIFDLKARTEMNVAAMGHFNRISAVSFVDADRVVTSDLDGVICLWDARSSAQIYRTEPAGFLPFRSAMAVSPDGQSVVLNPIAEKMTAFDTNTGELRLSLPGHGRSGASRAVQYALDGQSFVSWGDDQELRRWNISSGEKMLSGNSVTIAVPGYVNDSDVGRQVRKVPHGWFGHDAKSLFVEFEGNLREFDANDGAVIRQTDVQQLRNLSASPDGRWIATVEDVRLDGGQSQSTISLRDARTLQPVHHWIPGEAANAAQTSDSTRSRIHAGALRFSRDSSRIAWTISGRSYAAEVADVNTKKIVAHVLLTASSSAIDLSPDGTRLVIGSNDTTIGLWDLSNAAASVGDIVPIGINDSQ